MKITANEILFGHKLKEEVLKCSVQSFVDKVVEISHDLLIPPDWLMLVMDLETAGTFDPAITNSLGYTGLIQFGSARAKDVGTSRNALRQMDGCTQLEYVYDALLPFIGRMKHLHEVYLAVFFPAAIGKPLDWVLHAKELPAERIGKWNPLFDIDGDGRIAVWEIKEKLHKRMPDKYKWTL